MSEPVRVGSLADIPPGTTLRVVVDGKWVAVYNAGGELFATADECSHAVASLSQGTIQGYEITCPRHGARFDVRTGKALCLPAIRPVKTYSVKVVDEDVLVSS